MDISSYNSPSGASINADEVQSRVRLYLNKVYMWMALALLTTAAVAAYTMQDTETMMWALSGTGRFVCIGGSIGVFLVMLFAQRALTASALSILFLVYSGLTGLLFGPILSFYTSESLTLAFGCTAGTFGAMSIYGAVTKRNLSAMGRFLLMALIGLIICSIINWFWGNGLMELVICCAGVLIFSGLTAYDTQKLIMEGGLLEEHQMGKPAVMGALTLYLDFINLFLYFLRLLGNRD